MQKHVEAYKLSLEQAQAHIAHLREENNRIESEREQMESDLRRLQKRAFQRFESAKWTPASNAEIRRKLNQLDAEVKAWSKANSIAHLHMFSPELHPYIIKKLGGALQGFTKCEESGFNLLAIPDDKAWVLLQAYIMHRLYFDIFDHPFFGVRSSLLKRSSSSTLGEEEKRDKKVDSSSWEFGLSMQTLYYKFRKSKCFLLATVRMG